MLVVVLLTVDIGARWEAAARLCIESGHTRLLAAEDTNPDLIKGRHPRQLTAALGHLRGTAGEHRGSRARRADRPGDQAARRPARGAAPHAEHDRGRRRRVRTDRGIVAIEDIVEEIVGEIADETDPAAGPVRQVKDREWLVRGDVPLADLRDYGIELDADTERYNSLAGLVLDTLGHLPRPGDDVPVDGFMVTVESVNENRIELVRVSEQGKSATSTE